MHRYTTLSPWGFGPSLLHLHCDLYMFVSLSAGVFVGVLLYPSCGACLLYAHGMMLPALQHLLPKNDTSMTGNMCC